VTIAQLMAGVRQVSVGHLQAPVAELADDAAPGAASEHSSDQ
jgi:hypothetical protein